MSLKSTVDFSKFSDSELIASLSTVNAVKFPDNYKALNEEIESRKASGRWSMATDSQGLTPPPQDERTTKQAARRREQKEFRASLNASTNIQPTLWLMAICIAVTAIEFHSYGTHPTALDLFKAGGQQGGTTAHNDFWRLVSAAFLHADVGHIVANMIGLFIVGRYGTLIYKRSEFFIIYFVAAILGNVVSAIAHLYIVSVGASGAIFGLYGCVAAAVFTKDKDIVSRIPSSNIWLMLYQAIDGIYRGLGNHQVDNWCHVGGFSAGIAFGLLALYLPKGEKKLKRFAVISGFVTASAVFVALPLLVKVPYFNYFEFSEAVAIEQLRETVAKIGSEFDREKQNFDKTKDTNEFAKWIASTNAPHWQKLEDQATSELAKYSNSKLDQAKKEMLAIISRCRIVCSDFGRMNGPEAPSPFQLEDDSRKCTTAEDEFVRNWQNNVESKF